MDDAAFPHALRFLNDEATNSTSDGGDTPQDESSEGRDVYEFVAFVCWYLFLVLCCVIPALCAYRRRRLRQRRMSLIFLRGSTADGRPVTIVAGQDDARRILEGHEERIKQERMTRIQQVIGTTTMSVSEDDLVEKGEASTPASEPVSNEVHVAEDEEVGGYIANESYLYNEAEHAFAALRLPEKKDGEDVPNGSRTVPPACAICLAQYDVEDSVTWSPKEHCKHAFHKDCIVPWLAKKEESLCPCCRQEFCDVPPISIEVQGNNTNIQTAFDDVDVDERDVPAMLEASDGVGNT